MAKTKPACVTKSRLLKERGWTEAMVAEFLGDPDREAPNPRYRSGPKMRLYDLARVQRVEEREDVRKLLAARSESRPARKAAATKWTKTIAEFEAIEIPPVPVLPRDELVRRAANHYNSRESEFAMNTGQYSRDLASADSDPAFLARICVNFIRHRMTDYDTHLPGLFGRVGQGEAYTLLRGRVLDAIAEAYPWLAQECENQKTC